MGGGRRRGRGRSMKITVLTYLEREDDEKSYDAVIDQVAEALRSRGHDVAIVGCHGDLHKLIDRLSAHPGDLVFNLMETFGETQLGLIGVLGVMDVLGLKYTGGGPGEIYLQEDKALSKKLLAYEKIAYPDFAVFGRDADMETAGNLRMPLFVKPLRMDASIGIDANKSLVSDAKDMMRRVAAIHKLGDCALVEEYIEGREFLVGVLGNRPPVALPPVEIDFSGLPPGELPVFDAKAKWAKRSRRYKGTKAVIADIPDDLKGRLQRIAVDACRALRVREYARVDMRMSPGGEIYVIEVNASCYLDREGEFAMSAASAGIDYTTLVNRIADLAAERHGLIKANGKNGH